MPHSERKGLGELNFICLCGVRGRVFANLEIMGIRFFFADERKADGGPVGSKPDADGHGEMYLHLTEDDEVPYYATFVDGKYREFP